MKPRAVCPVCKRSVLLVKGRFRSHGFSTLHPMTSRCRESGRFPGVDYGALFVEFGDIVKAKSPEAWQLLHVSTVKELVRVAVERLRDAP